jgi:predicted outer membrane repeat protein
MSLFSWLRGSSGMAVLAQMGRSRRRSAPSRPTPRFRPRLEALEDRTVPSTFHVADVAGLQGAVAAVNANPSEQAIILLAPGKYDLTSELAIANPSRLVIKGNPSGSVVLDNPTRSDRIIEIDGPGDVTLDGLVITGGSAHSDVGGGIFASGASLTLDHCTLSGNSAFYNGGGVYSDGVLTVNHSLIAGNSSLFGRGGGIGSEVGVGLTVKDSTISNNSAIIGGGIYDSYGPLTLDHDTLAGNSATYGGGIFDYAATLTIDHSTISDNTAAYGGGVYAISYATVEIDHSTLNDSAGDGIVNVGSTVHLKETMVDGVLYQDQFYP